MIHSKDAEMRKIHHRIFTVCKAIMEKNIEKSTVNVVDNIFLLQINTASCNLNYISFKNLR